ncbi:hypothetical protein [Pseudoalteromonas obscura]|uniref:Uncharacterized protein n=1 Tax=Pseudoalteromonas obscura TaxID=3048491 RepID=A0ABT7EE83_9GAMM|nr:hypothetical protein [Pseudoalteromonas sp. P94(2023)]MDK2593595.1 hypothetical protein [Pseudoalteromonas sp. P94(2023)]
MILNTNPQHVSNYSSQYSSAKTLNTATPSTHDTQNAHSSQINHGWDTFTKKVEDDPKFAEEMAEAITFIPNKMMVNLNEAPPLTDPVAFKNWADRSVEFDKVAAQVTEQRIEIFNRMKGEGASDAEIFKEIISFNKSLPMDYQAKSGMLSVDQYA